LEGFFFRDLVVVVAELRPGLYILLLNGIAIDLYVFDVLFDLENSVGWSPGSISKENSPEESEFEKDPHLLWQAVTPSAHEGYENFAHNPLALFGPNPRHFRVCTFFLVRICFFLSFFLVWF